MSEPSNEVLTLRDLLAASEKECFEARGEIARLTKERDENEARLVNVLRAIPRLRGNEFGEFCAAIARADAAERERDEARKNYQFMVERAADQKLDGYRELAQRLNVADMRATAAESALGAATELLRRVQADNHFIYLNVADEVNAAISTVLAKPEAPSVAEEKVFRYRCKWHDNGCSCPMEESTPPETK